MKEDSIFEETDDSKTVKAFLFDKTAESWKQYGNKFIELFKEDFLPDEPLLGETDKDVIFNNVKKGLMSNQSTVAVLADEIQEPIGISFAIPIGLMDPKRQAESTETAYVYYTVVDKKLRGQGLSQKLVDKLFDTLTQQGFSYVERDSKIEKGFADYVQERYKSQTITSYDHAKWPQMGNQRHFRIRLVK